MNPETNHFTWGDDDPSASTSDDANAAGWADDGPGGDPSIGGVLADDRIEGVALEQSTTGDELVWADADGAHGTGGSLLAGAGGPMSNTKGEPK